MKSLLHFTAKPVGDQPKNCCDQLRMTYDQIVSLRSQIIEAHHSIIQRWEMRRATDFEIAQDLDSLVRQIIGSVGNGA